ncbi:MAG: DNA repair protein RecO [Candidatus Saccharibacteria bacterium]|nr:DNA repair protein RecO [Pseudorhodobacter sp.]
MEWRDQGILISSRLHGETSAIVQLFTAAHGRHAGVVRGGASRKQAATLQPGSQVQVTWSARLESHIGSFTVEPVASRALIMSDRLALAALNSIMALLQLALAERDPHPALWHKTTALLDLLMTPDWQPAYLRWELDLLEELGYGLDLATCAVTGSREDLAYVSPRSGRAVSRAGAGDYAARLLPLPPSLLGQGPVMGRELAQGLALTGHFLNRGLQAVLGDKPLPEARARLLDMLARA